MIRKSFWTGLASLAFAAQSLITNKLFSIYFGPQGVTLLAHFQNLIALFTTVPNDGINRSVIKFLSGNQDDAAHWNKYTSAALILNIVSIIATFILVACLYGSYVDDFPVHFFTPVHIVLIVSGIFFHISSLLIGTIILSSSHVIAYSILSILNNFLGLGLIYVGLSYGISESLIFLSFYPASALAFMIIYFLIYQKKQVTDFSFIVDKKSLTDISQFILIALTGVIFGRLIDFFIRDFVIGRFSLYDTGIWQAVVKVSDGYSTLFNAAFGIIFFSKASSIIHVLAVYDPG